MAWPAKRTGGKEKVTKFKKVAEIRTASTAGGFWLL